MLNRKELFLKLKERIQTEGTIRFFYHEEVEGKDCYCAVGLLMIEANMDLNSMLESEKGETVSILPERFKEPFIQSGFTVEELSKLQNINDSYKNEDERTEKLIEYIDELLSGAEA